MVPPTALEPLAATGLLPALEDDITLAASCSGFESKWGSAPRGINDFLSMPGGRGFLIDRGRLVIVMRDAAIAAGANWLAGNAVRSARPLRDGGIELELDDDPGTSVAARVVIDASGRRATVARRLGAKLVRGTDQITLAFRLPAYPGPPADVGFHVEGSNGDGMTTWCYAVVGPGPVFGAAVVAEPTSLPRSTEARREWAAGRLKSATSLPGWRNRAAFEGQFSIHDATFTKLDSIVGMDWIAIGDAACAFDPIASQGLANALAASATVHQIILPNSQSRTSLLAAYQDRMNATWRHSKAGAESIYKSLK
jgi:flavin-dependent dehydrogenase